MRRSARDEPPTALAGPIRPGIDGRDVLVDIAAERLAEGVTAYTVRLREGDGRPVTGATVTIHGRRRPDGVQVETSLDPTLASGVYRVAVRMADISDARLRVVSAGRIQDVPLPE